MPARRRYTVPKGLKPVRKRLASGEIRLHWYHRATGKALKNDPTTAAGLLEIAELDKKAETYAETKAKTLGALWRAYKAQEDWRALKPRTRSDYQAVMDWIGDAADSVLVRQITRPDLTTLRDKARKQRGRRFADYVVQVLRMLLEWGVDRGWRENNPAMGMKAIRRPTDARQVNRAWTDVEVRAFVEAAPPQLLVPFALGLCAGMRQGDALRVTWSAYNGAMLSWIASKNGEECAAPVAGGFKLLLDAAKERRGDAVQIALTSNGTPWTESGFRASFFKLIAVLKKAGKIAPGCTFHGLRYTVVSGARDDGQSDYRAASAIGDKTTAMASLYGRNANARAAQVDVLEAHQQRYANIDWKPDWKPFPKPTA
jgi:integrase